MDYDTTVFPQSDEFLCYHIQNLQFKHKTENDKAFMHAFPWSLPHVVRDVDCEFKLLTESYGTRKASCDDAIRTRGYNVTKPLTDGKKCVGYDCFDKKYSCDFLLDPCQTTGPPTHLVQDEKKICSMRHQLFNNVTKRR